MLLKFKRLMLGQEWHQRETSTICLVEAFYMWSLDLQARLHYASADSRVVHIAEVMRYLIDHAGAGHTVSVPSAILTLLVSPSELMVMNKI